MLSYSMLVWRFLSVFLLIFSFFFIAAEPILAKETSLMGMHIMFPGELRLAKESLELPDDNEPWHYVTVPFTLGDLEKKTEWQSFMAEAKDLKVVPLVRLATKMEAEGWKTPTQKDIVDQLEMLSELNWPTNERFIIIFNEVNHAKEWGGSINPAEYAELFRFASKWARTENKNFVVMPAAMDLAAPNGRETMEAFTYLNRMHAFDSEIFSYVDVWNSHSYPNPGFSSSPTRIGQNSLRGFQYELAYLKNKTGTDYRVFITETGWEENARITRLLPGYYDYALRNIWTHPQVVAVTPFILRGSPGPFSGFSFLDANNKPTRQYQALKTAMAKKLQTERLLSNSWEN
jgi:hypothetical protein